MSGFKKYGVGKSLGSVEIKSEEQPAPEKKEVDPKPVSSSTPNK